MPNKMSYDNPFQKTYSLGQFDYGTLAAGTEILEIPIPLGVSRAKVESIALMASEVFTTGAKVEIGNSADPNKYAELIVGTLADAAGLDFTDKATQLFDAGQGGGRGIIDTGQEALTSIRVTLTGSGAAGTGIATTDITLAWW